MTQATQNTYFNLTADGIGFMNRPRTVKAKRGNPYYACTIHASRGDAGDKSRFDVRIVGSEAKELFAKLLQAYPNLQSDDLKQRPTVLLGFRVGDLQAITFETTSRETGEKIVTPTIDCRLLKFKFIKVNGEYWYREQREPSATEAAPAPADEDEMPF